jgi:pimeloyl-ACP methyl ester carboxylesterase
MRITRAPDGALAGVIDSPQQNVFGVALDRVDLAADSLIVSTMRLRATYRGTVLDTGRRIEGTWVQGTRELPLTFVRAERTSALHRPQEPQPPYPYREVEVTYEVVPGSVRISGTLTIPPAQTPAPAVLLISGSGAQDRDGTVFGHRPLRLLADHLTRSGFVVLRSDDRGTGRSTGNVEQATIDDFVRDAQAGVKLLRSRREEVDPGRIGIIGHSEGAVVAAMAAARDTGIASVVLLSAPAMPGDQLLLIQARRLGRSAGLPEETIEWDHRTKQSLFAVVRNEPDSATAARQITEILAREARALSEADRARFGLGASTMSATVQSLLRQFLSPYFRRLISLDPREAFRGVGAPLLAVYGERDVQVPPIDNSPLLRRALAEGGNRRVTIRSFDGLNHLLQTSATGALAEYAMIEETLSPNVLSYLAEWLVDVLHR